MSDDNPNPVITVEDLAATYVGFALSFTAAILNSKNQTPNDILEALARELQDTAKGMLMRGDPGSPAAATMLLTAAMLEASDPKNQEPSE